MWKKYWKFLAAAAFLAVAGFCYGCVGESGQEMVLGETVVSSGEESSGGDFGAEASGEMAPEKSKLKESQTEKSPGGEPDALAESSEAVESNGAKVSTIFVHVCGQVVSPGVYELPAGSRIYEAVEAAGGFSADADTELLNLAAEAADGMKITVLSEAEAKEYRAKAGPGELVSGGELAAQDGTGGGNATVNLNTATKEELMTLKGIGESKAEDIIRYREESGGFQKIEDIMKVPGIKDAGFQKIKDRITV